MRLEGESKGDGRLWRVTISLAESEARELRDALDDLLAAGAEPGWHSQVAAGDFQTEVTLVREDSSDG